MRPNRLYPPKAVTWALIPLLLVGSLPRVSCLCADGEHKLVCERVLLASSQSPVRTHQLSASRRSCCHGTSATRQNAVASKACCAQRRVATCDENGQSCRPLFDVPAFVAAVATTIPDHHSDVSGIVVTTSSLVVQRARQNYRRECRQSWPAPDLVIAHQSLVI